MAYIIFRLPTANSRMKARKTRHAERADVRTTVVSTTAQALAHRDRLNGRGYMGRAYQVTRTDDNTVVTQGGVRIRLR